MTSPKSQVTKLCRQGFVLLPRLCFEAMADNRVFRPRSPVLDCDKPTNIKKPALGGLFYVW